VIWIQSIVLFIHVLGAIFWFGSGLMLQFFLIPALRGMPFEAQHPWLQALTANYSRIIGPVGGLTVLFGIVRGLLTGVLGLLNTPYGITFVAAFVLAVPVIIVGARFIGPTAGKLAAAGTRDEVDTLAAQMSRYGRIEAGGMLVMLALMVAMHAGY
jgi:uncharacterized membrane protein